MSERKYGLTITFDIDLFTPCTKYEANLDGLDFPINIPLSNDESRLLFGKNAAMADDYYQALHYAQKSGLYDSIKQALEQNFELMGINTGTKMGIGYAPVGVMRDLTLHGVYPYAIALEVSDKLNNDDRLVFLYLHVYLPHATPNPTLKRLSAARFLWEYHSQNNRLTMYC